MAANEAKLAEWNPANGWGDYDSALAYLGRAAALTTEHMVTPGAVLRWDC